MATTQNPLLTSLLPPPPRPPSLLLPLPPLPIVNHAGVLPLQPLPAPPTATPIITRHRPIRNRATQNFQRRTLHQKPAQRPARPTPRPQLNRLLVPPPLRKSRRLHSRTPPRWARRHHQHMASTCSSAEQLFSPTEASDPTLLCRLITRTSVYRCPGLLIQPQIGSWDPILVAARRDCLLL